MFCIELDVASPHAVDPLCGAELATVENLEPLQSLTALNLSTNLLTDVHGLLALSRLADLDLHGNALGWDGVRPLGGLPHLRTLRLSGNPVAADPLYRVGVSRLCPTVTTLDGEPLGPATAGRHGDQVRRAPLSALPTLPPPPPPPTPPTPRPSSFQPSRTG